jgi:hypothetical protein
MSNAFAQNLAFKKASFFNSCICQNNFKINLSKIANTYMTKECLTDEICQRKFGCVKGPN